MQSHVDLSYIDDARKVWYDIESLSSVWTVSFLHESAATLWFFGDACYDSIDDDTLRSAFKSYFMSKSHRKAFNLKSENDIDVELERFHVGDEESMQRLSDNVMKVLTCTPILTDASRFGANAFVEYYGWNSARYDLKLLVLLSIALSDKAESHILTPSDIRQLSNTIIRFNGKDWQFADESAQTQAWRSLNITAKRFKYLLNLAIYCDGHVDLAQLARATDSGDDSLYPPALKKEMARFGLDIIIDEDVGGESQTQMSDDAIIDLVSYNLNDVLGTCLTGRNQVIESSLSTRDIVRKMYPYTSAKALPADKIGQWTPPERDCSAAKLASLVLIGERHEKPVDSSSVTYDFPVPLNGDTSTTQTVDLFKYICEIEQFTHPLMREFFDYYRDKVTTTRGDIWRVNMAQPVTHSAKLNVPYYRGGKSVDSYCRISTGGAHGSVMAGLHEFSESDVDAWIRSDIGAQDAEKPTIDLQDVVHLDFASFYPVMASKMGLYLGPDGVDRYTDIITQRFSIKSSLPFAKSSWTHDDYVSYIESMGLKFILNNATGAGNMHQKYALLPLDNKTLSMRLIGNMLIWCLGQRLTEAGGFIIATNTDGLYCANITVADAGSIIDKFIADYGMSVEPEKIDRFINRDTSSRIEIVNDSLQDVRGRLRHGAELHYTDDAINRNVPYPLAAARAAIDYMRGDKDWLQKPYDAKRMHDILIDIYGMSTTPEPWYHIHVGTGKRRLTIDGVRQQKINRVIMTTKGHAIGCESARKLKIADAYEMWKCMLKGVSLIDAAEQLGLTLHDQCMYCDMTTLTPARKDADDDNAIVACNMPKIAYDIDTFKATMRAISATCLAAENEDHVLVPIESWNESALTGYTSSIGVTVNTADELENFDMTLIDVDAYQRWAESLLASWKVTADMPEINLKSVDDTVVEKIVKRRVTKSMRALKSVEQLYDEMLVTLNLKTESD